MDKNESSSTPETAPFLAAAEPEFARSEAGVIWEKEGSALMHGIEVEVSVITGGEVHFSYEFLFFFRKFVFG